jgi:hypothetical protein
MSETKLMESAPRVVFFDLVIRTFEWVGHSLFPHHETQRCAGELVCLAQLILQVSEI